MNDVCFNNVTILLKEKQACGNISVLLLTKGEGSVTSKNAFPLFYWIVLCVLTKEKPISKNIYLILTSYFAISWAEVLLKRSV